MLQSKDRVDAGIYRLCLGSWFSQVLMFMQRDCMAIIERPVRVTLLACSRTGIGSFLSFKARLNLRQINA